MDKDNPFVIALKPPTECAPHTKKLADNVCSTKESLDALKSWLKSSSSRPEKIIEEAKKATGCDSESCLYKAVDVLNDKDLDTRFNPKGPWNSTRWLSNTDIDDVLDLYNKKFPRFKHVEFQMRDFATHGGSLARVNWKDVSQRYDCLGCILNTDVTGGRGEHWTALFIDYKKGTVEYFDSAGQTPHREFSEFVINTAHQLSQITGKKFRDVLVTKIEHQKENTECGVYSLYYILSRLHGVEYRAFEFRRVPDDMMVEFRKFLFRHS